MAWRKYGNKYNNKKTVVDGIKFDSKKESLFYLALKKKKKDGDIKDFEMQVPIVLQDKFRYKGEAVRAIKYIVDFIVTHNCDTKEYVDVKGYETKEWKIKWKMLKRKLADDDSVLTVI